MLLPSATSDGSDTHTAQPWQTPAPYRWVLKSPVCCLSFDETVSRIIARAQAGCRDHVWVSSVHQVIEVWQKPDLARSIIGADMVTADGMPLTIALRLLYGVRQERVAGMDLLPALVKAAEAHEVPVAFLGSTPDILERLKSRLSQSNPNLKAVRYISPPFRQLLPEEKQALIDDLSQSGARLVFVALGCPKQERWMVEYCGELNAVLVGIGAALGVMAGVDKRAPRWMQKTSLEWLHRLIQDPKRLFMRYAVTNTLFIVLVLGQCFRRHILGFDDSPQSKETM